MKNDPRQLELIAHHIEVMVPADVLERIGATKDRALHMRVLRILSEYGDVCGEVSRLREYVAALEEQCDSIGLQKAQRVAKR